LTEHEDGTRYLPRRRGFPIFAGCTPNGESVDAAENAIVAVRLRVADALECGEVLTEPLT